MIKINTKKDINVIIIKGNIDMVKEDTSNLEKMKRTIMTNL